MIQLLLRWVVLAVAVYVATKIRFLGIVCNDWAALLTVSLLLGIANAVVKPILMLITLPAILISFGVFVVFINAGLFYLVGSLVSGFQVPSFWSALGGSVVISLVSFVLSAGPRRRTTVQYWHSGPRRSPPPGNGPIIDV